MGKKKILFLIFGTLLVLTPSVDCSNKINETDAQDIKKLVSNAVALCVTAIFAKFCTLVTIPAAISIPIAYSTKNAHFIRKAVRTTGILATLSATSLVATWKLGSNVTSEVINIAIKGTEEE